MKTKKKLVDPVVKARLRAAAKNPYGVATGQVWKSLDRRENRTVRIVDVQGAFATVRRIAVVAVVLPAIKIRLDQFKKRWIRVRRQAAPVLPPEPVTATEAPNRDTITLPGEAAPALNVPPSVA
jgi:hypothetical protein